MKHIRSIALSGANAAHFTFDANGRRLIVRDVEAPTVDRVTLLKMKPYGLYQRTTDGLWRVWRGKRGWLRVRSAAVLEALG